MATVAVAARIPEDHARSLRQIADLSGVTVSTVLARLVVANVPPLAPQVGLTRNLVRRRGRPDPEVREAA